MKTVRLIFFYFLILVFNTAAAQRVGIGTNEPDSSAILDISSNTKGVLLPRLNNAERNNLQNAVSGLTLYNTDTKRFEVFEQGAWKALQPEFPAGTQVLNRSYTSPDLEALGYNVSGHFDVGFVGPSVPVTAPASTWLMINNRVINNTRAPVKRENGLNEFFFLSKNPMVMADSLIIYFNQDSIFHYNMETDMWTGYFTGIQACKYAVWTGNEVLGWNGFDTIYKYYPISNQLIRMYKTPIMAEREAFSMVWTGTELIIWGGRYPVTRETQDPIHYLNNGARFNVTTNSWTLLPVTVFAGRAFHTAVWTGTEMIICGGERSKSTSSIEGGGYNDPWGSYYENVYDSFYTFRNYISYKPSTNTWTAPANGGFSPRSRHSAVWTGSEMIIFGGINYANSYGTDNVDDLHIYSSGSKYKKFPNQITWTSIGTPEYPRFGHTAVWTGSAMMVVGGFKSKSHQFCDYPFGINYASTKLEFQRYSLWYQPIANIWSNAKWMPNGLMNEAGPFAFYRNGKYFAFGCNINNREQGFIYSNSEFTLLKAPAPVFQYIYSFERE